MSPIDDQTLIEVRPEWGAGAFFCCLFATVAILTIAWGNVMDGFILFKSPFAFTTTEQSMADIAKGIRTPDPQIAIVGSSLSKRLDPGLFTDITVINLSLGGGSVMTGLEILRSVPVLPKVILVEINILDRPFDEEWKNTGAFAQSQPSVVLTGISKPLRYIFTDPPFSYISPDKQAAWWNQKLMALRSGEAAEYDIQAAVTAGQRMWDKRNSWDIANRNFKHIQELTIEFELRGAKVYLLYLPYADGYDNHAFARRNREIASGNAAFLCQRCIDVRKLVAVEGLRWDDGAHLDDRSALIVAEALEKLLF